VLYSSPLPSEAKRALKEYLLQNETNKALKEEAKKAAWEEDQHYKAAWEAVLDKQEKERTDR
jgi:adenosine deaminase